MTFSEAVKENPEIKEALCKGFQALKKADKAHLAAQDNGRIRGSVNVDETVKDQYPDEARWDYAIGHQPVNLKEEMVYWIEIHPATEGEVKSVIAKVEWLKTWLKATSPKLNTMRREFLWISSGKTSLTPNSPQAKKLASHGIQHKGRHFTIPNEAAR